MSNLIKKEIDRSSNYKLKTESNNLYVLITEDNVAKVEAMVATDSKYRRSNDINACPSGNYLGSSAYFINIFKNDNLETINAINMFDIVSAIDRENSTHLNADNVGRIELTNRICSYRRSELIEKLKYPYPKYELINLLSNKTNPDKSNGRANYSFATKFCHYMCFHLFEGTKYQDNFPIYDNVIKKYIKVYNNNKECNFYNYSEYVEYIDEVIKLSGAKISRNGLDHLLWYFYK